jgi:hypothetical protein
MATSTIPAAKGALLDTLTDALDDVLVTWSTPAEGPGPEWVRIGDVTGAQRAAAVGRQRRAESYTVQILVSVVKAEIEDPQEVAGRAFEIVADIEDAIRTDETLGGVLIWARVEKTDLREGLAGGERWAEVTVHVGCESRI